MINLATMSPANGEQLHRIFESLDQNKDGQVSIDEFEWLLHKTGVHTNRDELVLLMGKEGLDLDEFSYFYGSLVSMGHNEIREDEEEESCLLEAFKVFDLNGDGFLSPEEIREVLLRLGMWKDNGVMDCKGIVRVYDTNSDGVVDFDEFKRMMLAIK